MCVRFVLGREGGGGAQRAARAYHGALTAGLRGAARQGFPARLPHRRACAARGHGGGLVRPGAGGRRRVRGGGAGAGRAGLGGGGRQERVSTGERDETCPISTEGWTRRVHFVREGRGGGGGRRSGGEGEAEKGRRGGGPRGVLVAPPARRGGARAAALAAASVAFGARTLQQSARVGRCATQRRTHVSRAGARGPLSTRTSLASAARRPPPASHALLLLVWRQHPCRVSQRRDLARPERQRLGAPLREEDPRDDSDRARLLRRRAGGSWRQLQPCRHAPG